MHDEEPYRYQQPQACIDELRDAIQDLDIHWRNGEAVWRTDKAAQQALDILERSRP